MTIGRLLSVAAIGDSILSVQWDDGRSASIEFGAVVRSHTKLAPLNARDAFAAVKLSEDGWSIEWPGLGIDFGAPQLRRWADEQSGEAMALDAFKGWMQRHDLTASSAANALGLDHREIERFLTGEAAIPKTVMLATVGLDKKRAA